MQKLLAVVVLLVAFVFAARAEGEGSDVVVLTSVNFKEKISNGGTWLVEYFAPWCGHCKHLAPTWEKLATALKGDIHVAKVDCTVENTVCSNFGVRGYPTIKLIAQGKYYDYKGARTIEAFTEFAKKTQESGTVLPAAYAEVIATEDKHLEL